MPDPLNIPGDSSISNLFQQFNLPSAEAPATEGPKGTSTESTVSKAKQEEDAQKMQQGISGQVPIQSPQNVSYVIDPEAFVRLFNDIKDKLGQTNALTSEVTAQIINSMLDAWVQAEQQRSIDAKEAAAKSEEVKEQIKIQQLMRSVLVAAIAAATGEGTTVTFPTMNALLSLVVPQDPQFRGIAESSMLTFTTIALAASSQGGQVDPKLFAAVLGQAIAQAVRDGTFLGLAKAIIAATGGDEGDVQHLQTKLNLIYLIAALALQYKTDTGASLNEVDIAAIIRGEAHWGGALADAFRTQFALLEADEKMAFLRDVFDILGNDPSMKELSHTLDTLKGIFLKGGGGDLRV